MGRGFKRIVALLLLVIGILLFSNLALATTCTPSPDPWFDVEILIDETTLPVGVTFERNSKYPQYDKRYFFENVSNTPLYIVMGSKDMGPVTFLSALDVMTNLPFRIDLARIYWIFRVQNEVNYYHHRWWSEGQGYRGEWKTDRPGTSIYSKAFIDVDDLEATGIKTQQIKQDDRPAIIGIPQAQNFVFRVYYGDRPVEIHGKFVYSLNRDYNPKAGEEGLAKCLGQFDSGVKEKGNSILVYAVVGIVAISVYLLVKKRKWK